MPQICFRLCFVRVWIFSLPSSAVFPPLVARIEEHAFHANLSNSKERSNAPRLPNRSCLTAAGAGFYFTGVWQGQVCISKAKVCISCWQISSFSSKALNPGHMTVYSARNPISTDVWISCRHSTMLMCVCVCVDVSYSSAESLVQPWDYHLYLRWRQAETTQPYVCFAPLKADSTLLLAGFSRIVL